MADTDTMKVLFLSTYPPRECGIATFTQDIVKELKKNGNVQPQVIAINDGEKDYPDDVYAHFNQHSRFAHLAAADLINETEADLLMIEHEYGIYGGNHGEYLLDLVERLFMPFMVTCHTVLPNPDPRQREVLSDICFFSSGVIVMSQLSREMLVSVYGVDKNKIYVLHHGVPEMEPVERESLKQEEALDGRTVISTFGLLSPGKGLEYGIRAVGDVVKEHPEVHYLVLGQTHPVVKKQNGEEYRETLEQLVSSLGIEDNVQFINRYLDKQEILRYLQMSDIYMTPYLGMDQAVSGTLAYAIGCGRVVVSTPYIYAQEMLADGRGMLARPRDAQSLSGCLNTIIENPDLKMEMEQRTKRLGDTMSWPKVCDAYENSFRRTLRQDTMEVYS